MSKVTTPNRFTLITSIDYVCIGPVRTFTHALLVESTSDGFLREGIRHRLRGFTVHASSPTFDLELPTCEFTLTDARSGNLFIGGDDQLRPLFSGSIMRFPGLAHDIELIAKYRSNIDVLRLPDGTEYDALWLELERRVAHHWTAPFMPRIEHRSANMVRGEVGRPSFPVTKETK